MLLSPMCGSGAMGAAMSRQRPRGMQQGSAKWYRYWMRRWGKRVRNEEPRNHRPSLRGTAGCYEHPWWMARIEPYENPKTTYGSLARWRSDR